MRTLLFIFFLLSAITIKAEQPLRKISKTSEEWTISATESDSYAGCPIANGRIGILPWSKPFEIRHIILNNVYEKETQRGISKIQKGINPFGLALTINKKPIDTSKIKNWSQQIDLRHAWHNTQFTLPQQAKINYQITALGCMPNCGLIDITIKAEKELQLTLKNKMLFPSNYIDQITDRKEMNDMSFHQKIFEASAKTAFGQHTIGASSAFFTQDAKAQLICTPQQHSITLHFKKGEIKTISLVGSICNSQDFHDPIGESERQIAFISQSGLSEIRTRHNAYWDKLWKSDIEIEGDLQAQKDVRFALFNLYGAIRPETRLSIPPMGLSSQCYNGHVFWDAELWMYPPLLYLHPELAKNLIDYRIDRLSGAKNKAQTYGYKGALFPWESDHSGQESTPTWCLTGTFEMHVSADVAIAAFHYYEMTKDLKWLKEEGFPLLQEIACFWCSKAVKNKDGSYSIRNVVGADEYRHGATDNAFTNGAVKLALQQIITAAQNCQYQIPKEWKEVADNIRILSFDNGITQQDATYQGEMIKQADANLLGYPLLFSSSTQQKKDLAYYSKKIDPVHGPAMSFSIFSIQYARLGMQKEAYEAFKKCYLPNKRPPFGVLSETPSSNNAYFMTGAGGFLQAIINGFGGLQLTSEGIKQLPSVLPKHWKRLTIKGVGPQQLKFTKYNQ